MAHYTVGIHAVVSLLENHADSIEVLYLIEKRKDKKFQQILSLAGQHKVAVERVSKKTLQAMSEARHQGAIAKTHKAVSVQKSLSEIIESADCPLILVLDQIQDPHNLGAIMRSSAAFSVDAIVAPKDNACSMTDTVEKIACGGASIVPFFQVSNLARALDEMKQQGLWLVGLDGASEQAIHETDLKRPLALLMGNEQKGLRALSKKYCDYLVKIVMPGEMESLNVSVATGVALYERVRQSL